MTLKPLIGYADFIRLCNVENPTELAPWAKLEQDGIYIVAPDASVLLFPGERAVLTEHPFKDLTKPVLSFPCTLEELISTTENIGMAGCICEEELKIFLQQEKDAYSSDLANSAEPLGNQIEKVRTSKKDQPSLDVLRDKPKWIDTVQEEQVVEMGKRTSTKESNIPKQEEKSNSAPNFAHIPDPLFTDIRKPKNRWDEYNLRRILDESREVGMTHEKLAQKYEVSRPFISKTLKKANEMFDLRKASFHDALPWRTKK